MDVPIEGAAEAGGVRRSRPGGRLPHSERRARLVAAVSLAVMAVELLAGGLFNSMALIGDGLHTSTHAAAMLVAAGAYAFARRRTHDARFVFGMGKVGDLAAFASGVALAAIALLIAVESVQRLITPEPVALREAAAVAALGLVVSLFSAGLLRTAQDEAEPGGVARAPGDDLNLWAAYLHMLADVVTSVLAIAALLAAAALGWRWLDPAVGLVNAAVVATFAYRLLKRASAVLLDMAPADADLGDLRRRLEVEGDRVLDLKVWSLGRGRLAVATRIATARRLRPADVRARLAERGDVAQVFVEIEPV